METFLMRSMMSVLLLRGLALPSTEDDLRMEILILRRQVQELQRRNSRTRFSTGFRLFWVLVHKIWPRWKEACVLIQPATVIAWHRRGFKLFWKWKSRSRAGNGSGRKGTHREIRELIRRMAAENPTWGAPRIHGEILKLGIHLSERTVSRLIPKRTHKGDDLGKRRQTWRTFLKNHRDVIAAMDFIVVPTWNFRQLYILVILRHGRRVVPHINITSNPTAEWVKQQLREAFPYDKIPKYLIFDRDTTFGAVKSFVEAMGIEPKQTAFHSPWQNGAVERFNGTLRRELLDHIVVLNEGHLQRLISHFLAYYHEDRTHLALDKDTPLGRKSSPQHGLGGRNNMEPSPAPGPAVVSHSRVGGLHHRYEWREAA